jgi:hypothetical protein
MLVALYCCEVFAALALGAVSAVVVEFYTRLIERTPNIWLQFVICFSFALPFGVIGPFLGCVSVLGLAPLPADMTLRAGWVILIILAWATVLWRYIIRNWQTLNRRMDGTRRT